MDQLEKAIKAVEEQLTSRGFSQITIRQHRRCWNELKDYLDRHKKNCYDPICGIEFLADAHGITTTPSSEDKYGRTHVRSIKYLNDYLEYGTVFPCSPAVTAVSSLRYLGELLADFKDHRCRHHGIAKNTLLNYDRNIGKFLLFAEGKGKTTAGQIDAACIRAFLPVIAEQWGGAAHNLSCTLRVFLRYLKETGVHKADLSYEVPSFEYRRKSKLPSSMSQEEVSHLLESVDRSGPVGKRDYAIILLACRLGLRSVDIRNLEFSNIHWESNTIELAQQKTKELLTLPLTEEVGCALIDYVKNARPKTTLNVVFLAMNAPTRPISASGLTAIVKRYAAKAEIDISPKRNVGPHLMRNALASALLKGGVSLPEISGILGHSSSRTTQQYYLRIDDAQLRQCALAPHAWAMTKEEVF